MGKTYRYSPEGNSRKASHRVDRREINNAEREMALYLTSRMLPVVSVSANPQPHSLIEAGWIPPKEAASSAREWFVRDQRLDLIQMLGEQMLQAELET